jgi:hypothetical protein
MNKTARKPKPWLDMENPIVKAVFPAKKDAQDRAERWGKERIAKVLAELAANGWDLNKAAPNPSSFKDSRNEYKAKRAKREHFASLIVYQEKVRYDRDELLVARSEAQEARFIETVREMAGQQYESFIFKMVAKIGEVETAALEGNHVWGESYLTVTKAGGVSEVWKTQQIVNHSIYGTPYNQWPSRKLKAAKQRVAA